MPAAAKSRKRCRSIASGIMKKKATLELAELVHNESQVGIEDLPAELQMNIFQYLGPKTRSELALCNKRLYQLSLDNERFLQKPLIAELIVQTCNKDGEDLIRVTLKGKRFSRSFVFNGEIDGDSIQSIEDIIPLFVIPHISEIPGNVEENFRIFISYVMSKVRFKFLCLYEVPESFLPFLIYKTNSHGRKFHFKYGKVKIQCIHRLPPTLLYEFDSEILSAESPISVNNKLEWLFSVHPSLCILAGIPLTFGMVMQIFDRYPQRTCYFLDELSIADEYQMAELIKTVVQNNGNRVRFLHLTLPENIDSTIALPIDALKQAFGQPKRVPCENNVLSAYKWDLPNSHLYLEFATHPARRVVTLNIDHDAEEDQDEDLYSTSSDSDFDPESGADTESDFDESVEFEGASNSASGSDTESNIGSVVDFASDWDSDLSYSEDSISSYHSDEDMTSSTGSDSNANQDLATDDEPN